MTSRQVTKSHTAAPCLSPGTPRRGALSWLPERPAVGPTAWSPEKTLNAGKQTALSKQAVWTRDHGCEQVPDLQPSVPSQNRPLRGWLDDPRRRLQGVPTEAEWPGRAVPLSPATLQICDHGPCCRFKSRDVRVDCHAALGEQGSNVTDPTQVQTLPPHLLFSS